jgi:hypothetical protein
VSKSSRWSKINQFLITHDYSYLLLGGIALITAGSFAVIPNLAAPPGEPISEKNAAFEAE